MRVLFLAYRQWALDVYPRIQKHPKISDSKLCTTHKEFIECDPESYDLILTCGWSDELGDIANKVQAIGVHCAELDRYSYGSPIQLQIMDGIKYTKHRIFPFKWDVTSKRAHTHTREYSHETVLDLTGSMKDILHQMTETSVVLFNMFLDDYPNNIVWKQWPEEDLVRPKRSPSDSELKDISNMTARQIYDFIRCLEDPYPNAYIRDETGTVYFKNVEFKE